jgi:pyridoxal phosphate phosphatase PHOSPHO2
VTDLGEELTSFLERHGQDFDKIIYIGDGANDFCPVLRLRSQDFVYCRRHRGLETRIKNETGLKCQVQYWNSAWEVEEMFRKL